MQEAVRKALLVHKRLGNPIAVWRDGRVVLVPPEEIDVPEEARAPRPGARRKRTAPKR